MRILLIIAELQNFRKMPESGQKSSGAGRKRKYGRVICILVRSLNVLSLIDRMELHSGAKESLMVLEFG